MSRSAATKAFSSLFAMLRSSTTVGRRRTSSRGMEPTVLKSGPFPPRVMLLILVMRAASMSIVTLGS